MDYPQGPRYQDTCREALRRGIVINTVQCGNIAETTPFWKDIAKLGEGEYLAIAQDGGASTVVRNAGRRKTRGSEPPPCRCHARLPTATTRIAPLVRSKQALSPGLYPQPPNLRSIVLQRRHTVKRCRAGGELLDELAARSRIKPGEVDAAKLPAETRRSYRQRNGPDPARCPEKRNAPRCRVRSRSLPRNARRVHREGTVPPRGRRQGGRLRRENRRYAPRAISEARHPADAMKSASSRGRWQGSRDDRPRSSQPQRARSSCFTYSGRTISN